MTFKDRFSNHAVDYAQYRPNYPSELFEYLASIAPDRQCAWDCATGSGQAALGLAPFFDSVIATDASERQIANATSDERIIYRVANAVDSGLISFSISLVTVAQALHWFSIEDFFGEAKRVLKPGGALAIWTYNLCQISAPIDALIEKFYEETVGPFWDFERKLVETGYRTIKFPFAEMVAPEFEMQATWSLDQLLGYLRTWSATKGFIAAHGFDPVDDLAREISELWGNRGKGRATRWPLSVRVGTIS